MRVSNTNPQNPIWCSECGKISDYVIETKRVSLHLCKNCAWNLADLLNQTPDTHFMGAER